MSAARTERLLNLVFVLTNAARPLPKSRLREVVYPDSTSDDAFERMFERDKEELRNIGVPIETVSLDPLADDDLGYRLSKDWALPQIEFTAAELSVLAAAASAWEDACLAPAALTALRKLEASGDAWDAPGLPVAPRVATADPGFATVLSAINSRRELRFDYRKPDGVTSARRLQPHGLVQRNGLWYVVGHDMDRAADRIFRLSRMQGEPKAVGPANSFEPPLALSLEQHAAAMAAEATAARAVIRVRPGSAIELRHRATSIAPGGEHDMLIIEYRDARSFSAAIAAHGEAVVVEDPATLRDAVIERLRGCLA